MGEVAAEESNRLCITAANGSEISKVNSYSCHIQSVIYQEPVIEKSVLIVEYLDEIVLSYTWVYFTYSQDNDIY
ncbi:hypothetical protein [uncultured Bacteroides sp.]|uniref:hypothetical protein n=1 Tax=uncultured Bacteroides sp. TaxID=162156 RepID=UPI0025F433C9|nr:hypothetical protein [uncultured Bacteroides sp.]